MTRRSGECSCARCGAMGAVNDNVRVAAATLTLSLTAPIAPHLAQLHSPERLVIDLPGTRQAASLPSAPPGSMVTALRAGVRGKHALRLVLEFKSAPASAPRVTLIRHSGAQRELRIEIG